MTTLLVPPPIEHGELRSWQQSRGSFACPSEQGTRRSSSVWLTGASLRQHADGVSQAPMAAYSGCSMSKTGGKSMAVAYAVFHCLSV